MSPSLPKPQPHKSMIPPMSLLGLLQGLSESYLQEYGCALKKTVLESLYLAGVFPCPVEGVSAANRPQSSLLSPSHQESEASGN